jgi:hypothetical protein
MARESPVLYEYGSDLNWLGVGEPSGRSAVNIADKNLIQYASQGRQETMCRVLAVTRGPNKVCFTGDRHDHGNVTASASRLADD